MKPWTDPKIVCRSGAEFAEIGYALCFKTKTEALLLLVLLYSACSAEVLSGRFSFIGYCEK